MYYHRFESVFSSFFSNRHTQSEQKCVFHCFSAAKCDTGKLGNDWPSAHMMHTYSNARKEWSKKIKYKGDYIVHRAVQIKNKVYLQMNN